jgi:hypothetical protein
VAIHAPIGGPIDTYEQKDSSFLIFLLTLGALRVGYFLGLQGNAVVHDHGMLVPELRAVAIGANRIGNLGNTTNHEPTPEKTQPPLRENFAAS